MFIVVVDKCVIFGISLLRVSEGQVMQSNEIYCWEQYLIWVHNITYERVVLSLLFENIENILGIALSILENYYSWKIQCIAFIYIYFTYLYLYFSLFSVCVLLMLLKQILLNENSIYIFVDFTFNEYIDIWYI